MICQKHTPVNVDIRVGERDLLRAREGEVSLAKLVRVDKL